MRFRFKVSSLFLSLILSGQMIFAFEMSGNLVGRKYQLRNSIAAKQKAYGETGSDLLAEEISELEAMLLSVEEQIKLGDERNRLKNEIRAKERARDGMDSSLLLRGRKMQLVREISKLEEELFSVEEQIDRAKARLLEFGMERSKGTELGHFYQLSEELRQLESEYRQKRNLYAETKASWKIFLPFGRMGQLARELSELRDKIQLASEQLDEQKNRISSYGVEEAEVENSDPVESLDEKVDSYASQNSYISNCVDRVPEGEEIRYSKFLNYRLCRKIPFFFDVPNINPAEYTISKREGRIVIKTSIYANYKGSFFNRKEALEDIRETVPCIQDFYARHGIKLDLTIRTGDNPLDMVRSDHFINFYDSFYRPDFSNWAIYVTRGGKDVLTKDIRCRLFTHELGHSLGLDDTYRDSDCPDRERIMPRNNIMSAGRNSNIHYAKLYPYAIEKLLKPLCGEMPSE